MTTYHIYLGDPFGHDLNWNVLCTEVKTLFDRVIAGHATYDTVEVIHSPAAASPQPNELLCYVVPSVSDALVGPFFANTFGGPGTGGLTGWNTDTTEVGSEVYANLAPDLHALGGVIFHEFLHNKTRWTDQQLHTHPSGGLARSPIHWPMTGPNEAFMRARLATVRPQWTGGWAYSTDPLRGL